MKGGEGRGKSLSKQGNFNPRRLEIYALTVVRAKSRDMNRPI
jgi:hypothetical protein